MPTYRIAPLPSYTPTIGHLVATLSYARETTLRAVAGLTREQLDHLHDEQSNRIGALLAHIAGVERGYQLVTFDEREPTAAENDAWSAAMKLATKAAAKSAVTTCSFTCTSCRQDGRRHWPHSPPVTTCGSKSRCESHRA